MKKNTWIVLAVVILLVIGGVIWYNHNKKSETGKMAGNGQTELASLTGTPPAEEVNASSTSGSGSSSVPTTFKRSGAEYTKAVNTYQYRIQFDDCRGVVNTVNTGTLAVKKGAKVMLDNRDKDAHTFAFKGYSIRIPGDSYAIATASVAGEYPITCDGGGAAKLIVN